ncbi:MAG: hypothetical protein E7427_10205, partial [Ruminococcaceae bacterium]|nr:hypothetical protein [Oscillospiraceae bacterium]
NPWGVSVGSGSFTMNGGAITDNRNEDAEEEFTTCGVLLGDSQFVMNGGIISGNVDGVEAIGDKVTKITMTGGTITKNAEDGIYVENGSIDLSGGTVSDNGKDGIYVENGSIDLFDGTVSDNGKDGIHLYESSFTMTGGTISSCRNGVYVRCNCDFTLSGGTINGCEKGVWVGESFEPWPDKRFDAGKLILLDAPVFSSNGVDIFLAGEHFSAPRAADATPDVALIRFGGALTTKGITVQVEDEYTYDGWIITDGLDGKGSAESFASADKDYHVELTEAGEAILAPDGAEFTLTGSPAMDAEGRVTIYKGDTLTLTAEFTERQEDAQFVYSIEQDTDATVRLSADGDGVFTIKGLAAGEAAFTVCSGSRARQCFITVIDYVPYDGPTDTKPAETKTKDPFDGYTDLDPAAWYRDGVAYVLSEGYMQGTNGIFDPNGLTTRGAVAALLWSMAGKPDAAAAAPFADVAPGAPYADAVAWAAEQKIALGWTEEDGTAVFHPEDAVTREQFAAMLYRYARMQGMGFEGLWAFQLDFPDAAAVSDWAKESISWLVMKDVIRGMDGNLNPRGGATRAQIATMVQRFSGISEAN